MQPLILMPTRGDNRLMFRGSEKYLGISDAGVKTLQAAIESQAPLPASISARGSDMWGLDLQNMLTHEVIMVRDDAATDYQNASWELNLRCDYDCSHCYLGPKPNDTLAMDQRAAIIQAFSDLGVYRLQLTGGEPLIDRWFEQTYRLAAAAGITIRISTNGSQLHRPRLQALFAEIPPQRITVSLYGASTETYETFTRTKHGTFERFKRGLQAAKDAGCVLRINVIISRHNEHEQAEMEALARSFTEDYHVYGKMSATIHGAGDVLTDQASTPVTIGKRLPPAAFTSCNAGTTFFHVDPLGRASICKVGREPFVQLNEVGAEGMHAMRTIAEQLLTRADGCTSCGIQTSCSTCPPMVATYRQAGAPNSFYCQHP